MSADCGESGIVMNSASEAVLEDRLIAEAEGLIERLKLSRDSRRRILVYLSDRINRLQRDNEELRRRVAVLESQQIEVN